MLPSSSNPLPYFFADAESKTKAYHYTNTNAPDATIAAAERSTITYNEFDL